MIIKLDPNKVAKIENQQRSLLTLSLTQLITGLVKEKWISNADGIEWAGGTLPATVISLIQELPVDEQIAAKLQALSPNISRLDTVIVLLGGCEQQIAIRNRRVFQNIFQNLIFYLRFGVIHEHSSACINSMTTNI